MRPPRVMHIIDNMGLGGAQRSVLELALGQKGNVESLIYSLRSVDIQIEPTDASLIVEPSHSRYSLKPILRARRLVKDHHINILHAHLFRSQVVAWILKCLFFPKIILVFHERGHIFEITTFQRLWLAYASGRVDYWIAVSNAALNRLRSTMLIPEEKAACVHTGVDITSVSRADLWSGEPRKKLGADLGLPDGAFLIGAFGRLEREKNLHVLIEAVVALECDFRLLIAGTGSLLSSLRLQAEQLGVANKVIFLGYRSDMDLLYKAVDVVVVPSLWEAFPRAVLESSLYGASIIASKIDGTREIIRHGENGLLFDPRSVQELTAQLAKLSSSQDLRDRLRKAARITVENRYRLTDYVTEVERIYTTVIENADRHHEGSKAV